jgi:peptidoglycan/xylan/chitin deacetylase (PgdA/CDA1 family)
LLSDILPAVRTHRPVVLAALVLFTLSAFTLSACVQHVPAATQAGAVTVPTPTGSARPAPSTAAAALPGATRAGLRPPVVTNGPRTGNKVALTFDADMTDSMLYNLASGRVKSYANIKVIDILEGRRIPATFFLTGEWVERYPDVARRLAADPRFELGNHTYKHQAYTANCYQLPRIPPNLMTEDVAHTFRVIEPLGGRQTRYFRFPGGCYDEAALQALAPLGVTVIQWDVVSGDPFATAAAPIVHAVLSQVKPGSIVVMHVTEANARYTGEALPPILDGLQARGLQPVTLSELLSGRP